MKSERGLQRPRLQEPMALASPHCSSTRGKMRCERGGSRIAPQRKKKLASFPAPPPKPQIFRNCTMLSQQVRKKKGEGNSWAKGWVELKAAAEDKVCPAQRTLKRPKVPPFSLSSKRSRCCSCRPGLPPPLSSFLGGRELDVKEKRQQQERDQKTGSGQEPLPCFDHYLSCSLPLGPERYSQQVMDRGS